MIYEDITIITANRWPPTPTEKQVGKLCLLCGDIVVRQYFPQYSIRVCLGEIIDENIYILFWSLNI